MNFLFDNRTPVILDWVDVPIDPELAARNAERAKEAIKQLGPKWVLYRDARTFDEICGRE